VLIIVGVTRQFFADYVVPLAADYVAPDVDPGISTRPRQVPAAQFSNSK
jgi:hypothetical protein